MCKYCEHKENMAWSSTNDIRICELEDIDTGTKLNKFVISSKFGDSLQIHYCPMCGRKLGEKNNEV